MAKTIREILIEELAKRKKLSDLMKIREGAKEGYPLTPAIFDVGRTLRGSAVAGSNVARQLPTALEIIKRAIKRKLERR